MGLGTLIGGLTFETGDLGMVQIGPAATVLISSSPGPAHVKETYYAEVHNSGGTGKNWFTPQEVLTPGTEWVTIGFKVMIDNVSSQAAYRIAQAPQTGGSDWEILVDGYTGLRLNNGAGAQIGSTVTSVFAANTEVRIELKYKKAASSDVELWVNGVSKITASAQDMTKAGTTQFFHFHNNSGLAHAIVVYFCSIWWKTSDGTNAIGDDETELKNWTYIGSGWQHDTTLSTADTLDSGTWPATDETPSDANHARYSPVVGDLIKDGAYAKDEPNGDGGTLIDGTIVGACWVWKWNQQGPFKSFPFLERPVMRGRYGSHATKTTDGTTATAWSLGTAGIHWRYVFDDLAGTECPGPNDFFQGGFGANRHDGIDGDVDLYDFWTLLLHKEPEATGKRLFTGNYLNDDKEMIGA